MGSGPGHDQFPYIVINLQNLVDTGAAPVAGVHAVGAAFSPLERGIFRVFQAHEDQRVPGWLVGFGAVFTHFANQPLGHGDQHHRRDQKGLHPHVDKPGDGAGRVVGVNGAENHVAGKGRLGGHLGGFTVANFAHHDHVRVLAQNGPQPAGKGHAGPPVQLGLANLFDTVLHRVFQGDDVNLRPVDPVDHGKQGGAFAAARGPGGQDHAVGFLNVALEFFLVFGGHAQLAQGVDPAGGVQEPQHHVFPVNGGNGGNPDVDLLVLDLHGKAAVLGNSGHRNVQVGQNLEPGDNGEKHGLGRGRHLVQNPVDTQPHLDVALFRADVNITGSLPHRLGQQGVDQPHHRCLLGHVLQRGYFRGPGVCRFLVFSVVHGLGKVVSLSGKTVDAGAVNLGKQVGELLFRADHGLHLKVALILNGV